MGLDAIMVQGQDDLWRVTSPHLWRQANGEVEAQNKTLLKVIRVARAEGKVWQQELHKFIWLIAPHLRQVQVPC